MTDKPRCPKCGYTKEDAALHLDHHLCSGAIPIGEAFAKAVAGPVSTPTVQLGFGDYCTIEQKRYGVANEHYSYKVINRLNSNGYIDIPVDANGKGLYIHDEMVPILECVNAAVGQHKIERFRESEVKGNALNQSSPLDGLVERIDSFKTAAIRHHNTEDRGMFYNKQLIDAAFDIIRTALQGNADGELVEEIRLKRQELQKEYDGGGIIMSPDAWGVHGEFRDFLDSCLTEK